MLISRFKLEVQRGGAMIFRVCAVWLACVASVVAQQYPNRPIRFVCPYPAGGSGDIFARVIGAKLAEAFGQQVVIDKDRKSTR